MEMELEAGAIGSEFALGAGDDRLRKRARVADRNNAGPAGPLAHRSHQHGVAKGRATRRRVDRKDISAAGEAGPRAESRRERHADERSKRSPAGAIPLKT